MGGNDPEHNQLYNDSIYLWNMLCNQGGIYNIQNNVIITGISAGFLSRLEFQSYLKYSYKGGR